MSAYSDVVKRQERAAAIAAQAGDPVQCPKCFGDLDTGYECTRCGYDAQPATIGQQDGGK